MRRTPEQLEAALLAEAKALIAELVTWERQAGAPKLSQLEEQVLAVRQQFGQRLLKALIEDQEARQPVAAPACSTCGATLHYKGQKGTAIETRVGGIRVERGYYYCAHCESGLFPLSAQLDVVAEHLTPDVARQAVWLAGLVPYQQAEAILAEIGQVTLPATSIWRRVQHTGGQFAALEEAERAQVMALPERWDPPSRAEQADQRMGVSMDGFMVHLRAEGWKEMKLGAVFELALRPERDTRTGERSLAAHAVNLSYAAHLGGPEVFGELVFTEARRRGWEHAQATQVIGDGAAWIWNQTAIHFGQSRQLVDWYHAKQHLAAASRLVKGEGTPASTLWLNSRETALYQGHAERIACELEQARPAKPEWAEEPQREAGYFRQHQHRMNYLEMCEEDWVIGSGMVEGGAKRYQARLCGPGMRWSRKGAENLTPIRTTILSGRFVERWRAAQNLPPV